MYDINEARQIIQRELPEEPNLHSLVSSFATIIEFLNEFPDYLSWRGNNRPNLERLANKYISGYLHTDLPAEPGTIPDQMVSVIMNQFYEYEEAQLEFIKVSHQHSMCAENCVGALLERYIASYATDWSWCCGNFVKAIDFLQKDTSGAWNLLQIKNRDNTENSSSSAIRNGTEIAKWFRTFSRTGATNWDNPPPSLQRHGLSEQGFVDFVRNYIRIHTTNH